MEKWDVKKISWEFEPVEEAWHIMKGPYAHKMDGSKKNGGCSLTAPEWLMPSEDGCGCYVLFRLGTDVSLVASTTGTYSHLQFDNGVWDKTNRIAVARQADVYNSGSSATIGSGGMAIVIQRHYNIEMPDGTLGAIPTNAILLYNGYGNPSGTTLETNIEEDNPATVPSNPPK